MPCCRVTGTSDSRAWSLRQASVLPLKDVRRIMELVREVWLLRAFNVRDLIFK